MMKNSIILTIIFMTFVFSILIEAQERNPCPKQKDCAQKPSLREKNFRRYPPKKEAKHPLNILEPAQYIKQHIQAPQRFKMNLKVKEKPIELDLFLIRSQ